MCADGIYDAEIDSVTGQTIFTYGSDGRIDTQTDALGHVTRFSYTERGDLFRRWGNADYPVEFAYDEFGQRTGMTTFRGGGTSFDGASWPSSPSGDTTSWVFKEHSPLLWKKIDAATEEVVYDYDEASRLVTRQWARGITTTYGYASDGSGDRVSTTL